MGVMRLLAGLLVTELLEELIDTCLLALFSVSCPLQSDSTRLSPLEAFPITMFSGFSTLLFSSCFPSASVFLF